MFEIGIGLEIAAAIVGIFTFIWGLRRVGASTYAQKVCYLMLINIILTSVFDVFTNMVQIFQCYSLVNVQYWTTMLQFFVHTTLAPLFVLYIFLTNGTIRKISGRFFFSYFFLFFYFRNQCTAESFPRSGLYI